MRVFVIPSVVSVLALGAVLWGLGTAALVAAVLLVVLEVTLSFDNAVVNARVLAQMDERWRRRFLTWGILIAVVGTRIILPILIVSLAALLSPLAVAKLALFSPEAYAQLLVNAHVVINAFGGAFLLMVALKYFFDESKTVHWIYLVEHHLARFGRIEALEIVVALAALLGVSAAVPPHEHFLVLASGVIGITLFILMQGITSLCSDSVSGGMSKGFALFVYLNVLDSAFSLDSVVGAFALSTSIIVIAVGLGVGAYFVRSLTVYFVERGTLASLIYLEHGAHWAIFGLAMSMFAGIFLEVPELVTGTIGLAFVAAAYYSSLVYRR